MNFTKPALLLCSILALQVSACSWVKLTPEGEQVREVTKDEISSCKKMGKTTVSIKAKVIGVKRKSETVESELRDLARNAGARMGGNTILPVSDTENGEKTFEIYQCENK